MNMKEGFKTTLQHILNPLSLHLYDFLPFWPAHSDMNVVTILVGNKTDLKDAREVNTEEGKTLAEAHGLFFMETSALDSSNVKAAFETVVREIYSILSRKVMMSQELRKQEVTSLSNGKTVILQSETVEAEGASRYWCCS